MRLLPILAALFFNVTFSLSALGASPSIIYALGPPSIPLFELAPENDNGWKGLYIEIAEEIFVKELGYRLVIEQYPWKRAQQNVREGIADITFTIPTAERLEYALVSDQPILKMYLNLYTYAGHPKLGEIRKIKTVQDIIALGLKPVTNLGNGWHKENIENAGVTAFYVPNDENIIQFLALKRADIMIDAPIFMNHLIQQYNLESKIVKTDVMFGPLNFHLLVSKNSRYAQLMPKINEVINELEKRGTFERGLQVFKPSKSPGRYE